MDEQVPRPPLAGALIAQGLAAHVCAVNTPFEQVVEEPEVE